MNNNNYDDIIDLKHPRSLRHPPMSRHDRAAQFAPFAALTGHKEAVNETARLTVPKKILDENKKALLDQKMQIINNNIDQNCKIKVTYFIKDDLKDGGAYVTISNYVKKIDEYSKEIIFKDGLKIKIDDIFEIKSALF